MDVLAAGPPQRAALDALRTSVVRLVLPLPSPDTVSATDLNTNVVAPPTAIAVAVSAAVHVAACADTAAPGRSDSTDPSVAIAAARRTQRLRTASLRLVATLVRRLARIRTHPPAGAAAPSRSTCRSHRIALLTAWLRAALDVANASATTLDITDDAVASLRQPFHAAVWIATLWDALVLLGAHNTIKPLSNTILDFVTTNLLPSTHKVPCVVVDCLAGFFTSELDHSAFEQHIATPSQRLLLRSPEIVLPILSRIVAALSFNAADVYSTIFINAIASQHVKATNVNVRDGAFLLAHEFAIRCWIHTEANPTVENSIVAIVDTLLSTIAKASSAELRLAIYDLLEDFHAASVTTTISVADDNNSLVSIRSKVATLVADKFQALFSKENESNLSTLFQKLRPFLIDALINDSGSKTAAASWMLTNIKSTKIEARRASLQLLSDVLGASHWFNTSISIAEFKTALDSSWALIENVSKSHATLLDTSRKDALSLHEAYLALTIIMDLLEAEKLQGDDKLTKMKVELGIYVKGKFKSLLPNLLSGDRRTSVFFDSKYYSRLVSSNNEFSVFTRFADYLILGPGKVLIKDLDVVLLRKMFMHISLHSKDHESLSRHWNAIEAISNDLLHNDEYSFLVDLVAVGSLEHLQELSATRHEKSVSDTGINEAVKAHDSIVFEENDVQSYDMWNSTPVRDSGNPLVRIMYALTTTIPRGIKCTENEELSSRRTSTLIRYLILASHPEMCYVHGSDLWARMCFYSGTSPSDILQSRAVQQLVTDWLEGKRSANGYIGRVELPSTLVQPTVNGITKNIASPVSSKPIDSKGSPRNSTSGSRPGSARNSTTGDDTSSSSTTKTTDDNSTLSLATFRAMKLLTQISPGSILPILLRFVINSYLKTIDLFNSIEYEDLVDMLNEADQEFADANNPSSKKETAKPSLRESQKQVTDGKAKKVGKSGKPQTPVMSPAAYHAQEMLKIQKPLYHVLRIHYDMITTVTGYMADSSDTLINIDTDNGHNENDDEVEGTDTITKEIRILSTQLHYISLALMSNFMIGHTVQTSRLPLNLKDLSGNENVSPIRKCMREVLASFDEIGFRYTRLFCTDVETRAASIRDETTGGEGADLFVELPDIDTLARTIWEMSILAGAGGGGIYGGQVLPKSSRAKVANWWSLKNQARKTIFNENVLSSVIKMLSDVLHAQPEKVLPASTFAVIFPLLKESIMDCGGRIPASYREKLMQGTLPDIVVAHCGLAYHTYLPRCEWVRCLIKIIAEYPTRRLACREALQSLSISMNEIDETEEISDNENADEMVIRNEGKQLDEVKTDVDAVIRELLDGIVHAQVAVRVACINSVSNFIVNPLDIRYFETRLWVAVFDTTIGEDSRALWDAEKCSFKPHYIDDLISITSRSVDDVQRSAGQAICAALQIPDLKLELSSVLTRLYDLYRLKCQPPKPIYDKYGLVVPGSDKQKDPWESRVGVATVIEACASLISQPKLVTNVFTFLMHDKEYPALGDKDSRVSNAMLQAGLAIIEKLPIDNIRLLIPTLDSYLTTQKSKDTQVERIKECCVILLGRAASHLQKSDPTIPIVIDKLREALDTDSEDVQRAVMECLPPLIKLAGPSLAPTLIDSLLKQLYEGSSRSVRKGAAYGIAGVVKGFGIGFLNDYQLLSNLKEAVQDKKSMERRESALFAFGTLTFALGRLFEPYITGILPFILMSFSASQKEVRQATEDVCKTIMARISAYCVKLLLPLLLEALQERQWRTQTASIDVLASMAYLAPRQLSVSLPLIIPKLGEAISDTHSKVQASAKEALTTFGNVIRNPEIQELAPTLIAALVDPSNKTENALNALLSISFVHYIDGPSLALIIPIVKRALSERQTEVKRKAAQIMGNISSLTDPADLVPHLHTLTPGLKDALVDNVPEVRATSARAFGRMVESLGESCFPTLFSDLTTMLEQNTGVDRSGAAQGLSEIIAGLGIERLKGLLPIIIENANVEDQRIREGYMTLLIYLPATFGDKFQPFIGSVIPSILHGLADENDAVREASMSSAKMLVHNYATSSIDLLLPQLEKGLFDNNWRIRHASCQLVGSLLYRIAGVNAKAHQFSADEIVPDLENSRGSLIHALGADRYNQILASIYVMRFDKSLSVRTDAIKIWKSLVSNGPRAVKDNIAVIIPLCIRTIKSNSEDCQEMSKAAIAEIVLKMGSNVLNAVAPVLVKLADVSSTDVDSRSGTLLVIAEILTNVEREGSEDFIESAIDLVKSSLVDEYADVREAGALAFDKLQQVVGREATDRILPDLLSMLRTFSRGGKEGTSSANSGYVLDALKKLMSVRANTIFPILLPLLLEKPISVFNVRALASLVEVSGSAINSKIGDLMDDLLEALEDPNCPSVEDFQMTLSTLLAKVEGNAAMHSVLVSLEERARTGGNILARLTAVNAFKLLCECNTNGQIPLDYLSTWTFILIQGFNKSNATPLIASTRKLSKEFNASPLTESECIKVYWDAFATMAKCVQKKDIATLIPDIRTALEYAEEEAEELPDGTKVISAFELPKGIQPLFLLFLECLMHGNTSARALGAHGCHDLLRLTSATSLKPFSTLIAGPLIRVIGDRWPVEVKYVILECFEPLLDKLPAVLKPFIPQLQRTFVKALSEQSSPQYRRLAVNRIKQLIPLQPRLDQLATEFANGLKQTALSVQESAEQGGSASDATVTLNMYKDIMAAYLNSIWYLLDFSREKKQTTSLLSDETIVQLADGIKSIIGYCNKNFQDDAVLNSLRRPLSLLLEESKDGNRRLSDHKHTFQLLTQFSNDTFGME